jgi:hypothetical protein
MCHITEFVKQVIFERNYLHLNKKLAGILLAEPSNCHHLTSNQIGPIQPVSFSLSAYTALLNSPMPTIPSPLFPHTRPTSSPRHPYFCKLDIEEANKTQKN